MSFAIQNQQMTLLPIEQWEKGFKNAFTQRIKEQYTYFRFLYKEFWSSFFIVLLENWYMDGKKKNIQLMYNKISIQNDSRYYSFNKFIERIINSQRPNIVEFYLFLQNWNSYEIETIFRRYLKSFDIELSHFFNKKILQQISYHFKTNITILQEYSASIDIYDINYQFIIVLCKDTLNYWTNLRKNNYQQYNEIKQQTNCLQCNKQIKNGFKTQIKCNHIICNDCQQIEQLECPICTKEQLINKQLQQEKDKNNMQKCISCQKNDIKLMTSSINCKEKYCQQCVKNKLSLQEYFICENCKTVLGKDDFKPFFEENVFLQINDNKNKDKLTENKTHDDDKVAQNTSDHSEKILKCQKCSRNVADPSQLFTNPICQHSLCENCLFKGIKLCRNLNCKSNIDQQALTAFLNDIKSQQDICYCRQCMIIKESKDLYMSNCGHSFCENCLKNYSENDFTNQQCPSCFSYEFSLIDAISYFQEKSDEKTQHKRVGCDLCQQLESENNLYENKCQHRYCISCLQKRNNINELFKCPIYGCKSVLNNPKLQEFVSTKSNEAIQNSLFESRQIKCFNCVSEYDQKIKKVINIFRCEKCKLQNCLNHQCDLNQCRCSCQFCYSKLEDNKYNSLVKNCLKCKIEFCQTCNNYGIQQQYQTSSPNQQHKCSLCGLEFQQKYLYVNDKCQHCFCVDCIAVSDIKIHNKCLVLGCNENCYRYSYQNFYQKIAAQAYLSSQQNYEQKLQCAQCQEQVEVKKNDHIKNFECPKCQQVTCLEHNQLLNICLCKCRQCLNELVKYDLNKQCKFCSIIYCITCGRRTKTETQQQMIQKPDTNQEGGLISIQIPEVINDVNNTEESDLLSLSEQKEQKQKNICLNECEEGQCSCDINYCGMCFIKFFDSGIQNKDLCSNHLFCIDCINQEDIKCSMCKNRIEPIVKKEDPDKYFRVNLVETFQVKSYSQMQNYDYQNKMHKEHSYTELLQLKNKSTDINPFMSSKDLYTTYSYNKQDIPYNLERQYPETEYKKHLYYNQLDTPQNLYQPEYKYNNLYDPRTEYQKQYQYQQSQIHYIKENKKKFWK